jgi:putative ribosome biogenesis GTPase RsgA
VTLNQYTLHPTLIYSAGDPQPSTFNPQLSTLNPQPSTLDQYIDERDRLGANCRARLIVLTGQAGIGKATVLRRFLGLQADVHALRTFKVSRQQRCDV